MPFRADTIFLEGLAFMSGAVARLGPTDWERQSPCSEWRALDVLGHVGSAVHFGTLLLRDEGPSWDPVDPPGAVVEGEPVSWWEALVGPSRVAVGEADLTRTVESPRGPRTVADGLSVPAVDLFIHAWDIARSVGDDLDIPAEAIEFAHRVMDPIPGAQIRRTTIFAAEVTAPLDATASQSFIAWSGRNPLWAPTS